jgi:hypothetical protein
MDAPTQTAEQEAAEALAAEQARLDADGEIKPELDPPESYDDLTDLTDEQQLIANECATRDDLVAWVDQARKENAAADASEPDDDPDADPAGDLASEVEDAHAAATDEEDESGGSPAYQDDRTPAEKLAGGTPADPEPRHPTAEDDPGDSDDAAAAMILRGDGQLGWSVGGKKPTGASLRLTGGSFKIEEGQLAKGSARVVVVTGLVNDVGFRDKLDGNTHDAVECERKHGAKIIGAKLLPENVRVAYVPADTPTLDGELEL